ncbi:MAG TPA: RimK family alpha-L-glutamate ligase [Beijerinckiaceae bacterium]|jgi:glutathione synthase/RimK-type ligase-like ATP-grasp enzyme
MRAAARQDFDPVVLGKDELDRLGEVDALFIRDLTSPSNHTYGFARAAEARGMPVLDDSGSIMACSDKVWLHEALARHGIPAPRGLILTAATPVESAVNALGLPLVLKLPEGSFSNGVYRASSAGEAHVRLEDLLCRSSTVVAQEYMETAFDWRIGVLAGEPLFACRYHMAPGHWQIVNHAAENQGEGEVEPLALDEAPAEAVALALKASALIGRGLYGVDIKERGGSFYVIEVNDNPDLHHDLEASRRNRVWDRLAAWFAERAGADAVVPAAA